MLKHHLARLGFAGLAALVVGALALVGPDAAAQPKRFLTTASYTPAEAQSGLHQPPMDERELSTARGEGNVTAPPSYSGDNFAVQLWDEWNPRKVDRSVGRSFSGSVSGGR